MDLIDQQKAHSQLLEDLVSLKNKLQAQILLAEVLKDLKFLVLLQPLSHLDFQARKQLKVEISFQFRRLIWI